MARSGMTRNHQPVVVVLEGGDPTVIAELRRRSYAPSIVAFARTAKFSSAGS